MPSRPPSHRPHAARTPVHQPHGPRPTAAQRGYDGQWRGLRAAFIRQHPVCAVIGCGAPATDVDHIVAVRERPDLRLTWGNLRALCHGHHSAKTAREDGGFGHARRPLAD